MTKRVIACPAALTLALSLLPVTALADEPEVQTPNTTVEVSGGESGASQPEGTTTGGTEETGSTEGEGTGSGDESQETAYVAQIGDTKYDTLDEAIEKAEDGATITLLANCAPEKTFYKSLTFTGGYTVTYNVYGWRYHGELTFDGANLVVNSDAGRVAADNDELTTWCALVLTGTLTAKNGANITFNFESTAVGDPTKCAIYANNGCTIRVESGSHFTIYGQNTKGLSGQGIQLDTTAGTGIFVTGNSTFLIDGTNRGYVNSPEVYVSGSTFTVQNCTSNASNGGKFTAINSNITFLNNGGHGLSATTLTSENSDFNCSGNSYYGIAVSRSLEVDGKSSITANENGVGFTGGALRLATKGAPNGIGTIASGAKLTMNRNHRNALENYGTLTIEQGVQVQALKNSEPEKGGGVYNVGTMVLGEDVVLYNNHAAEAGDDIYSTGTITFGSVGSNWTPDDCGHRIDGWYYDGQEKTVEGENGQTEIAVSPRWNGKTTKDGLCLKGRDEYYKLYAPTKEAVSAPLALKAAHGYLNNNPPVIRDQYYTVTVNYVDEAGNTVAPSYSTGSLKEGTAYDVTAQDAIAIPGYTYKTTTGDPTTGTLNGNKVVTVVYTKTADIDDGNTPTDPGDPGSDIDDPNTPTSPAEPPKTGDMMPLFAALTTLSAAAIVLLAKKREEA